MCILGFFMGKHNYWCKLTTMDDILNILDLFSIENCCCMYEQRVKKNQNEKIKKNSLKITFTYFYSCKINIVN